MNDQHEVSLLVDGDDLLEVLDKLEKIGHRPYSIEGGEPNQELIRSVKQRLGLDKPFLVL